MAARSSPGLQSVLKLGCRDVRLRQDLRNVFIQMEDNTGSSDRNVLDHIVCADFSGVVIDVLRVKQKKERGEGGGKGGVQGGGVTTKR